MDHQWPDFFGESTRLDRLILGVVSVTFQLAEVILVVGAFSYAGIRTGSSLLNIVAVFLGAVGALWFSQLLTKFLVRLLRIKQRWIRTTAMAVTFIFAGWCSIVFLQVVQGVAASQM